MSKTLRRGSQGDEVMDLQASLNSLALDVDIDGIFGPKTEAAVKHLQTAYGLEADGIVGPKTWQIINEEVEKMEAAEGGGGSNNA